MTRKIGGATPPKPGGSAARPPRPRSCLGARIGAYAERARLADSLVGLGPRQSLTRPPTGPRIGIRIDA